jgi:hypothetical protein
LPGVWVPANSNLGAANANSLSVSSWVSMLNPHGIAPGSYVPASDGLVIGTVGYQSNTGAKCAAVAYGWTAAVGNVYATGGNDVMWTDGNNFWMWIVANSFVLPVTKGATFSIGVMQVGGGDVAAPTSFAWVPFGTTIQLETLSTEAAAAAAFRHRSCRRPSTPFLTSPTSPSPRSSPFSVRRPGHQSPRTKRPASRPRSAPWRRTLLRRCRSPAGRVDAAS